MGSRKGLCFFEVINIIVDVKLEIFRRYMHEKVIKVAKNLKMKYNIRY